MGGLKEPSKSWGRRAPEKASCIGYLGLYISSLPRWELPVPSMLCSVPYSGRHYHTGEHMNGTFLNKEMCNMDSIWDGIGTGVWTFSHAAAPPGALVPTLEWWASSCNSDLLNVHRSQIFARNHRENIEFSCKLSDQNKGQYELCEWTLTGFQTS